MNFGQQNHVLQILLLLSSYSLIHRKNSQAFENQKIHLRHKSSSEERKCCFRDGKK